MKSVNLSKTKTWQVVLIGLLIIISAALGVNNNASDNNSSGSSSSSITQQSSTNYKSSLEEVDFVRVVDGDTIVVKQNGAEKKIRLVGVDTPESVSSVSSKNCEEGKIASDYTKKLLESKTKLWISKDQSDTDRYNRLLRFVWIKKPTDQPTVDEIKSKMLNAILVRDGYAQAKDYAPDTTLSSLFHQLTDEAADAGLGVSYKWKDS